MEILRRKHFFSLRELEIMLEMEESMCCCSFIYSVSHLPVWIWNIIESTDSKSIEIQQIYFPSHQINLQQASSTRTYTYQHRGGLSLQWMHFKEPTVSKWYFRSIQQRSCLIWRNSWATSLFCRFCFGKWILTQEWRKQKSLGCPGMARTHYEVVEDICTLSAFSLGPHILQGSPRAEITNSNEAEAWRFLSQYCLSPVKTVQPDTVICRKSQIWKQTSYLYNFVIYRAIFVCICGGRIKV
jgi:hypothetical protein